MLKLLSAAALFILITASCAQQEAGGDGESSDTDKALSVLDQTSEVNQDSNAQIDFPFRSHDFGKIVEGDKAVHKFLFTNTGTDTLVIKKARASCGCTSANNSKFVAPGEEGYINVEFNSQGRTGVNNKTVTVMSNSKIEPEVTLQFSAEVLTQEEAIEQGVKPFAEREGAPKG